MSELTLQDLADRLDDVTRMLARQSTTLSGLGDSRSGAAGPDVPLLVDLHELYCDALRCAATAGHRREGDAFLALAGGLSRVLAGRGGTVVSPRPGDAFDAANMTAADIVATADPGEDRTLARLHEPGLQVGDRSVRPARVSVLRHGAAPPVERS